MHLDILERTRKHWSARSQSVAIPSNSGHASSADVVPTRFALATRTFGVVDARHPSRGAGEACDLFKIKLDWSKRLTGRSWRTFILRLARREAISRHGP
jgi:hypothetical protein